MDRFIAARGSSTAPDAPTSGTASYPKSGSPAGELPSVMGPYWFHMITESLRNVVVAGGKSPNHEDHTLLLQAIQTIVSNGLPDLSDASETVKGIVMLASVGEALGLIDAAKAITPATLAAVFGGANRSFLSSDHQQLPSGLIFQWQKTAMISSNSSVSITFPIAFPHECLAVLTTIDYAGTTTHDAYSSGNRSLTGCTIYANGAGGDPAFVLSIGY